MIPYDELGNQIIRQIEAAFTATQFQETSNSTSEKSWQEITDEELNEANLSFLLLGDEDLPFYLPALMRRALRQHEPDAASFDVDCILFELSYGPGYLYRGLKSIFTSAEEEAIATFLFFIARHGRGNEQETAEAALQIGWWKHLPEFAFSD